MAQLSLQGTTFRIEIVLDQARRRVARKIESAQYNLRNICMAACARGETPKAPQYIKWTNGIGTVNQEDEMLKIDLLPSVKTWLDTPRE